VPKAFVATNFTSYFPLVLYVTEGFWASEVEGVPPVNVHFHEVGIPVVRSLNWMGDPGVPMVDIDVKFATGLAGVELPMLTVKSNVQPDPKFVHASDEVFELLYDRVLMRIPV
jgi:hypothetical protein